ncbi:MAG: [LysW]-aminoadipate kinase [Anaerolineales bacterium]
MQTDAARGVLVVKVGGAEGVDHRYVCEEVAALIAQGEKVVLVHGGSAEADALGRDLGHPPRRLVSPSGYTWRYTDRRTLEIFAMATRGKINTLLVERLQSAGVNAIGLSGLDGRLLQARRKDSVQSIEAGKRRVVHDDYTGRVEHVETDLLRLLLDHGYTPVLAPMALASGGTGQMADGTAVNVDADRAAAAIAGELSASTLILLTAVPGLLRSFPEESSLIRTLAPEDLEEAMSWAQAGMKKKILAAREAIQAGVACVIIADGRIPRPIAAARAGQGTRIAARDRQLARSPLSRGTE